jgi:ribosomal-protein-alanine N-acetyltransferase
MIEEMMSAYINLVGDRIYLRDHRPEDLDGFHAWMSDPEVTRYLTRRTTTPEESLAQLRDCLAENDNPARTRYFLAVVRKQDGTYLGDAGFTVEGSSADLGYFLLKAYWGQGYATEAMRLMIAYCFTKLALNRVTAGCAAGNSASERVMQKCGLRLVSRQTASNSKNQVLADRLEYELLRQDWGREQVIPTKNG